ncbi:hypothetical protein, partial [Vreelandella sulfidaeris]|uniref:hypothetical protein n=1 Tax=Vreelandella sulfidaeris TaxID=115553 RepID=UPI0019D4E2BE
SVGSPHARVGHRQAFIQRRTQPPGWVFCWLEEKHDRTCFLCHGEERSDVAISCLRWRHPEIAALRSR